MNGFSKNIVNVLIEGGRDIILMEEITYTAMSGEIITIPKGTLSDGASVPQCFWNIIPPFGKYWLATVLHDYLYRNTDMPKSECDDLLLEAMRSLGVDEAIRKTIYEGVKFGGWKAFSNDRTGKV